MRNLELSNKRLLSAVVIGIAMLVIPAFAIFQLLLHHHPVYKASVELIKADAAVNDSLGRPIETRLWLNGRVWKGTASFYYQVSGPLGKAEATAVAVERDSLWKMEYILLKQPGSKTLSLPNASGYVLR